jgi:hypothetical protein
MIGLIIAGLAFLAAAAIVVGIIDAAQAARWREIAAERRERWESRQPQLHGPFAEPYTAHEDSEWDDD